MRYMNNCPKQARANLQKGIICTHTLPCMAQDGMVLAGGHHALLSQTPRSIGGSLCPRESRPATWVHTARLFMHGEFPASGAKVGTESVSPKEPLPAHPAPKAHGRRRAQAPIMQISFVDTPSSSLLSTFVSRSPRSTDSVPSHTCPDIGHGGGEGSAVWQASRVLRCALFRSHHSPQFTHPQQDKKTRDKAVKALTTFLSESTDEIPTSDMAKLWKGIFYCAHATPARFSDWCSQPVARLLDVGQAVGATGTGHRPRRDRTYHPNTAGVAGFSQGLLGGDRPRMERN